MDSGEAPRELLAAWMQFLKDDLTEAVSALHNRLTVISVVASMDSPNLTAEQREDLKRIRAEAERAAKITVGLLRRVHAGAPDTIPTVYKDYDGRTSGRAHLLIVEADEANRTVMYKLFDRLGHRVTTVTNGLDAFEVLRQGGVDCVLSDLRLPYVGGRTLFEQVEEKLPHLASRFVFVTGDYTDPEARQFLEHTGQPVIGKPYDVAVLLGVVAEMVEKGRAVASGA